MIQPYENVYLGNFIFALGFQAAKTEKGLSDKSVQLVQQTPDDKKLSDLFVNWSGKSFIFEFKRNQDLIGKELEKEDKKLINIALNSLENKRALYLSDKAHFLGFGLDSGLGFITYSSLHKKVDRYFPLHKFCFAMIEGQLDIGLNYEELKEYLAFIESIIGDKADGCGGFILNISDDGSVNMIPFENVNVLSKSLDIGQKPSSHRPAPQFSMR